MNTDKQATSLSNSEELWHQLISLSKSIQEFKGVFRHDSLGNALLKIDELEREIDFMMTFLQKRNDETASNKLK